jgi:hypothetical protein
MVAGMVTKQRLVLCVVDTADGGVLTARVAVVAVVYHCYFFACYDREGIEGDGKKGGMERVCELFIYHMLCVVCLSTYGLTPAVRKGGSQESVLGILQQLI